MINHGKFCSEEYNHRFLFHDIVINSIEKYSINMINYSNHMLNSSVQIQIFNNRDKVESEIVQWWRTDRDIIYRREWMFRDIIYNRERTDWDIIYNMERTDRNIFYRRERMFRDIIYNRERTDWDIIHERSGRIEILSIEGRGRIEKSSFKGRGRIEILSMEGIGRIEILSMKGEDG